MYRIRNTELEVFLAHPGGPFFRNKDEGYWGIPKGLIDPGEDALEAAIREFREETGIGAKGTFLPLGEVTQKSGKIVHAWAFAGEWDQKCRPVCNTFILEWPPASGKNQEFPEIDRVRFFTIPQAKAKMIEAQHPFLERLIVRLKQEKSNG